MKGHLTTCVVWILIASTAFPLHSGFEASAAKLSQHILTFSQNYRNCLFAFAPTLSDIDTHNAGALISQNKFVNDLNDFVFRFNDDKDSLYSDLRSALQEVVAVNSQAATFDLALEPEYKSLIKFVAGISEAEMSPTLRTLFHQYIGFKNMFFFSVAEIKSNLQSLVVNTINMADLIETLMSRTMIDRQTNELVQLTPESLHRSQFLLGFLVDLRLKHGDQLALTEQLTKSLVSMNQGLRDYDDSIEAISFYYKQRYVRGVSDSKITQQLAAIEREKEELEESLMSGRDQVHNDEDSSSNHAPGEENSSSSRRSGDKDSSSKSDKDSSSKRGKDSSSKGGNGNASVDAGKDDHSDSQSGKKGKGGETAGKVEAGHTGGSLDESLDEALVEALVEVSEQKKSKHKIKVKGKVKGKSHKAGAVTERDSFQQAEDEGESDFEMDLQDNPDQEDEELVPVKTCDKLLMGNYGIEGLTFADEIDPGASLSPCDKIANSCCEQSRMTQAFSNYQNTHFTTLTQVYKVVEQILESLLTNYQKYNKVAYYFLKNGYSSQTCMDLARRVVFMPISRDFANRFVDGLKRAQEFSRRAKANIICWVCDYDFQKRILETSELSLTQEFCSSLMDSHYNFLLSYYMQLVDYFNDVVDLLQCNQETGAFNQEYAPKFKPNQAVADLLMRCSDNKKYCVELCQQFSFASLKGLLELNVEELKDYYEWLESKMEAIGTPLDDEMDNGLLGFYSKSFKLEKSAGLEKRSISGLKIAFAKQDDDFQGYSAEADGKGILDVLERENEVTEG